MGAPDPDSASVFPTGGLWPASFFPLGESLAEPRRKWFAGAGSVGIQVDGLSLKLKLRNLFLKIKFNEESRYGFSDLKSSSLTGESLERRGVTLRMCLLVVEPKKGRSLRNGLCLEWLDAWVTLRRLRRVLQGQLHQLPELLWLRLLHLLRVTHLRSLRPLLRRPRLRRKR